jgi:5-methylcytosine-specific restriction protein A
MMAWNGRGSTRRWREQRARILRRDPVCQLGLDVCTQVSTNVDHIVPVSEGGTDHPANLRGVCANCHGVKTHEESARGRARSRQRKLDANTEPHPGVIPPDA